MQEKCPRRNFCPSLYALVVKFYVWLLRCWLSSIGPIVQWGQWNGFSVTIFYILWKTFWSWVNYARSTQHMLSKLKIVCTLFLGVKFILSELLGRVVVLLSGSVDGHLLRKWSSGCVCSCVNWLLLMGFIWVKCVAFLDRIWAPACRCNLMLCF